MYFLLIVFQSLFTIRKRKYNRKNGSNYVRIDDLEENGNTEVTGSEEETDDESSSKQAIATQSTT